MSEEKTPHIEEPTCQQCAENYIVFENKEILRFADWYPQMGGYGGKCLVQINKGSTCFDVYVWHDGTFPFTDGRSPVRLHHCMTDQFVLFGKTVEKFIERAAQNG